MANRWPEVRFQDLFAESLRNGLTRPKAVRGTGTKMINMGEIFAHSRIADIPMDRVPLSSEEAERYLLQQGDLLFARQSLVLAGAGKCCYVLEATEPRTFESHIIRARLNKDVSDSLFFFYFFNSPQGRQRIESITEQVAAAGIRGRDLAQLKVPCPTPKEQRMIAYVLGMLDDKIEFNRRMSETLEAMTHAIFKSWFVDYDPVRAKADDRQPAGMDAEIAAVFPDSFEDSSEGQIPSGWRRSKLGHETITLLGGTPSRREPKYWGGDIPWINSGKAKEFRIVEPSELITREGLKSSATKMLPSRTTVIAITGATLGHVSLTEIEACANQSIVGVLGSATLPSEYVYFWVKENIDHLVSWKTGGAQQHINKANVNELPVLCPNSLVLANFVALTRPVFDRIRYCCIETLTLAALRDTLLPKLISGKIRVKDAERFVEEHAG